MTHSYEMYARKGQIRVPFFARDDREASDLGLTYAIRTGLKVSVLDMAHERPAGRYVGTYPPTWTTETVPYIAFGVATADAPPDVN